MQETKLRKNAEEAGIAQESLNLEGLYAESTLRRQLAYNRAIKRLREALNYKREDRLALFDDATTWQV